MNTRVTAGYLTETLSSSFVFYALRNYRRDVDPSRRTEIGGDYRYFFSGNWFGLGTGNFLQSNELQLGLRSTLGGGVGNYLVRNNRWRFSALGGAAWTNENLEDPATESEAAIFFVASFVGLHLTWISTKFTIKFTTKLKGG